MKVTLEYDPDTGELWDGSAMLMNLGTHYPFSPDAKKSASDTEGLVKLKDAGFTASEIMQMKREGLV